MNDSESAVKFLVSVMDEFRSASKRVREDAVKIVERVNSEFLAAEFHVTEVPATLPEHSGSILRRVVSPASIVEPVPVLQEPVQLPPVVGDGPANTPTIS